MERRYQVLVDGRLAKTRKTFAFALKDKTELEAKGYKQVSVAYILLQKGHSNEQTIN